MGGVNVNVVLTPKTVTVEIGAPHQNFFAGVVGQGSWDVSVTATALTGIPTKFIGVAPFILSQEVFDPVTGLPFEIYTHTTDFEKTTGQGSDSPLTVLNVAWTNLGTGNVSSNDVKNALDGTAPINGDLILNQYIGQSNNGVHNALFDTNSASQPSVNTTLGGKDVAVPIVGPPIAGETVLLLRRRCVRRIAYHGLLPRVGAVPRRQRDQARGRGRGHHLGLLLDRDHPKCIGERCLRDLGYHLRRHVPRQLRDQAGQLTPRLSGGKEEPRRGTRLFRFTPRIAGVEGGQGQSEGRRGRTWAGLSRPRG